VQATQHQCALLFFLFLPSNTLSIPPTALQTTEKMPHGDYTTRPAYTDALSQGKPTYSIRHFGLLPRTKRHCQFGGEDESSDEMDQRYVKDVRSWEKKTKNCKKLNLFCMSLSPHFFKGGCNKRHKLTSVCRVMLLESKPPIPGVLPPPRLPSHLLLRPLPRPHPPPQVRPPLLSLPSNKMKTTSSPSS